ncbi:hypothetical protein ACSBOB_20530 [Mesorhizobium sp. ASY16-5R]|uniref:hypothetical protein n=1 Tax=Mesorhizobium sp. ASY16-5R TaxID=3445772 RepID=UPI003FA0D73B
MIPQGSPSPHPMVVSRLDLGRKYDNIGAHRLRTFVDILDTLKPETKTLVDLGAGHCKFSALAAKRGYDVTAVDGRNVRLPPDMGSVRFVESDVRTYDPSGFGVIANLGLFYHLELEAQKGLLSRCTYGAPVILETQVHVPEILEPHESRPWHAIVQQGSYEGVLFPENDNPMASIGNPTSFWHTEDSMLRLFADCGFREVQLVEPLFRSGYGARRFYVLFSNERPA